MFTFRGSRFLKSRIFAIRSASRQGNPSPYTDDDGRRWGDRWTEMEGVQRFDRRIKSSDIDSYPSQHPRSHLFTHACRSNCTRAHLTRPFKSLPSNTNTSIVISPFFFPFFFDAHLPRETLARRSPSIIDFADVSSWQRSIQKVKNDKLAPACWATFYRGASSKRAI